MRAIDFNLRLRSRYEFGAVSIRMLLHCACLAVILLPAFATHADPNEQEAADSLPSSISRTQAARFLSQATMGYSEEDIVQVQELGYRKWLHNQFEISATKTEAYIELLASRVDEDIDKSPLTLPYHKVKSAGNNVGFKNAGTAWMRAVLGGNDLLRQRVAWALSQILVTSTSINKATEGICNYYDLLLESAFSTYKDLLLEVTYHPIMGRYLSYLGNKKANPKRNQYPDENYARELMQLFSIGLWVLDQDGTKLVDKNGSPIPTYTNADVQELARVFTGFHLAGSKFGKIDWSAFDKPMQISEKHHDSGQKRLLNVGISLREGLEPNTEIQQLVNALARHQNTAPFISTKLIQHLVTSNPSRSYIKRVSQAWVKSDGDMKSVITAILLDKEARSPATDSLQYYGRLKGPLLRLTGLLKALTCGLDAGTKPTDYPGLQWWRPDPDAHLQQAPMRAPTVFNFFDANYSRPGKIADRNLRSPEFQLLTAATAATVANYFYTGLNKGFHRPSKQDNGKALTCDLTTFLSLSDDQVMQKLNLLLAGAGLSTEMRNTIWKLAGSDAKNRLEQIRAAVFLTSISPEAAIQR